jgi:4a-hydroxytetrahydrobiopterin dehydratase
MELKNKKCLPCEGGIPKSDTNQISILLKSLHTGWILVDEMKIIRKFNFVNFRHTMDFVNNVALLAEEEDHHPDIFISYGLCRIELWTHAIQGLSENDFILAAKIDDLI